MGIQYCQALSMKGRKGHLFSYENKSQVFYQNDNYAVYFWKGEYKQMKLLTPEIVIGLLQVTLFLTIRVITFGPRAGKAPSIRLQEDMLTILLYWPITLPVTFAVLFLLF